MIDAPTDDAEKESVDAALADARELITDMRADGARRSGRRNAGVRCLADREGQARPGRELEPKPFPDCS
jgi:hypothetical protein